MMKTLKLILPLLLLATLAAAQNSVLVLDKELQKVNVDPITGLKIDKIGRDRSNRPCARIKLHVNRMSPDEIRLLQVKPIGGNVVVMKSIPAIEGNGLVIELTAQDPVKFYIHHPKYGDSNPVSVSLEGDVEYRMEAWCNFLQTIVISCPKAGAGVWLDDAYRGLIEEKNNALTVKDVMMGKHKLRVVYGDDHAEQNIMVQEGKVFYSIDLESTADLQQYVVFKLQPAIAMVTLDGDILAPDAYGNATRLIKYGVHEYLVEAKDYHPLKGTFTLNKENAGKALEIPVTLTPAFGFLEVNGKSVEGASIYVDKEFRGIAPKKDIKLNSGMHVMNLVRPLYRDLEVHFVIHDNATEKLTPVMVADFSRITLEVGNNAEIYINDELKGYGSWTGDLASGSYRIRTSKEYHKSSSRTLRVVPGMSPEPIVLQAPEPIVGSLAIESVPVGAEIWIDGEFRGKTPAFLHDVLIGNRVVQLSKEGFSGAVKEVKIEEGKKASLRLEMDKQFKVHFFCAQKSASLFVDGIHIGDANGSYILTPGKHRIQVRQEGFRTYSEEIHVPEDASLDVNIVLAPYSNGGLYRPGTATEVETVPAKPVFGKHHAPKEKRRLGFNMGVGLDLESDAAFKEPSYGLKMSISIGDYMNSFNVESGIGAHFFTDLQGIRLPVPEEELSGDPDFDSSGSSSSDPPYMQYRIFLNPKYNIIRKSSSSSYYLYLAGDFSLNVFSAKLSYVRPVNLTTGLRVGAGFSNYDFSLYWLYEAVSRYNRTIDPVSYNRNRLGFSFTFYLF